MEDSRLTGKFIVAREDGAFHPDARYFVLNYATDPYARTALVAYADACENTHPVLARELRETVSYHEEQDSKKRRNPTKPKRGSIGSGGETASVGDLAGVLLRHVEDERLRGALDEISHIDTTGNQPDPDT